MPCLDASRHEESCWINARISRSKFYSTRDLLSIKYMETDIYFEYLQVFFFIEPMILNDINLFGLMFSFFPFVSAINK